MAADKWEIYKDPQGQWRWRRTAPNGNIVGAATQGYVNRADCEANARRNGWNGQLSALLRRNTQLLGFDLRFIPRVGLYFKCP